MIPNQLPSLNFDLGETADMLRDSVMRFASDEVAPLADEVDRSNEFPAHLWRKMGDIGILGVEPGDHLGSERVAREQLGEGLVSQEEYDFALNELNVLKAELELGIYYVIVDQGYATRQRSERRGDFALKARTVPARVRPKPQ